MPNMKLPVQGESKVSGVLGVVLYISKIFGLAPLKFKRVPGGWCISISSAACLYGNIFIYLICLLNLVFLILDYNEQHQSKYFKTYSETAICSWTETFVTLLLFLATYLGTHRMQCVIASLSQLQKVNIKLSQYGPLTPFNTLIPFISVCMFMGMSLLLGSVCCVTLYMTTEKEMELLSNMFEIPVYLHSILEMLLILQITLILAAVPASFSHLNNCVTKLLQQIRNHDIISNPADTAAIVNHLRTLYDCLCGVVKHIDQSHGVLLAVFVPNILSNLVYTFYSLITALFVIRTDLYDWIAFTIFILIEMIKTVMIIEPCHLTYEQMNRTKFLIGKLLLYTPCERQEVIYELELFYKYLINDVVYTPMGIFYFNRTVIVAIFGSITTYLVILIQP